VAATALFIATVVALYPNPIPAFGVDTDDGAAADAILEVVQDEASLAVVSENGETRYSTDGGVTWNEGYPEGVTWNEGYPEGDVSQADPDDSQEVVTVTDVDGELIAICGNDDVIRYSRDGGATWSEIPPAGVTVISAGGTDAP
jgi:hypothetical protein